MNSFPLTICDVSLRDGLQNEKTPISTEQKLTLLDDLVAAGLTTLELTSFVSPKAVPQMADADALTAAAAERYPAMRGIGLIFNEKGYERARAAGAQSVALVLIVSDSLSRSNSGKTADEWLEAYSALVARAKADGVWVRGYLAGAWVCPFEGQVAPARALHYAEHLIRMGVDQLCATDPIGHAHPVQVEALSVELVARFGASRVAVHLHDTLAFGLANAAAAMRAGVRIFDASLGGLGGCPFAPGAAGNLATEDLVLMAEKIGLSTGVDLDRLWAAVQRFQPVIGRQIGGRSRAWYDTQRAAAAASVEA
jgi:hydroxymethylglutaryl-CoA lyase